MWGYVPGGAAIATVRRAKYAGTRPRRVRRNRRQAHPMTQVIFWVAFVIVVAVFVF